MMMPSPCLGVHMSEVADVPPAQTHSGKIDLQSDEHPIPSFESLSSQISGGLQILLPQTSQRLPSKEQ